MPRYKFHVYDGRVDVKPDEEDLRDADVETALPAISPQAVEGLKFSAALPPDLAQATLAERFVDRAGARASLDMPLVIRTQV